MEFTVLELIKMGSPLLAIGGAWGGAKVALNGTRERVKLVENDLNEHKTTSSKQHIDSVDRLARIETKVDALLEKR